MRVGGEKFDNEVKGRNRREEKRRKEEKRERKGRQEIVKT